MLAVRDDDGISAEAAKMQGVEELSWSGHHVIQSIVFWDF